MSLFDLPILEMDSVVRKFILVSSASIVLNFISLLAAFILIYSLFFQKLSMLYTTRALMRYRILFGLIGGLLASVTVLLSDLSMVDFDQIDYIDALTIGLGMFFIFISIYGGGALSGVITWVCISGMRLMVGPTLEISLSLIVIDSFLFVITVLVLRTDLPRIWRWVLISTVAAIVQSVYFIANHMRYNTLALYHISMVVVAVVVYFIMYYVIRSLEMYMYFQRNAMQDYLTKLDNLRSLHLKITRLVRRMQDTDRNYTVMIADIDYFKSINDTYGHAAGDDVLRQFSKLLSDYCPKKDILARMGGEEFCLILSGSVEESEKLANQIRDAVASHLFQLPTQQSALITVSFGLAGCNRNRVRTVNDMHDVMDEADQALYAAKAAGRNRVSVYEAGDPAKHPWRRGWN